MSNVTHLLSAIEAGDPSASEELLPLVYDELRRLAAARVAHERSGASLQPTALVHEAFLRLVNVPENDGWNSRGHFFAAAAEAMRRILVDRARQRAAIKHGGDRARVDLEEVPYAGDDRTDEILDVHTALEELEQHDACVAKLVKLRYFAGFGHVEAAEAMGLTRRAADRLWTLGRAWLRRKISN